MSKHNLNCAVWAMSQYGHNIQSLRYLKGRVQTWPQDRVKSLFFFARENWSVLMVQGLGAGGSQTSTSPKWGLLSSSRLTPTHFTTVLTDCHRTTHSTLQHRTPRAYCPCALLVIPHGRKSSRHCYYKVNAERRHTAEPPTWTEEAGKRGKPPSRGTRPSSCQHPVVFLCHSHKPPKCSRSARWSGSAPTADLQGLQQGHGDIIVQALLFKDWWLATFANMERYRMLRSTFSAMSVKAFFFWHGVVWQRYCRSC